jgi:hypothetical protein
MGVKGGLWDPAESPRRHDSELELRTSGASRRERRVIPNYKYNIARQQQTRLPLDSNKLTWMSRSLPPKVNLRPVEVGSLSFFVLASPSTY